MDTDEAFGDKNNNNTQQRINVKIDMMDVNGEVKSPNVAKKRRRYNRNPSTQTKPSGLYYDVQDNPPLHLATMFGFQIALANIFSSVNMAVLVSRFICSDQEFALSLFATTSFMSGLCTILQTSWGVRLPMFQGPSILFIIPYIHASSNPAWGCLSSKEADFHLSVFANETVEFERHQPWLSEWNKVQGSLMLASVLQILIGCLGLGGFLLRLMGPLSITCLILLLGISINGVIAEVAEVHWGMSCLNVFLVVLMSQYINTWMVPMPTWSRKGGFQFQPFPLFELFPVLISVVVGWLISYIMTVCGVFTDDPNDIGYQARTDFAADAIRNAPIVTIPYPGQYGAPSFKLSYTLTLCVAVLGSVLESVGDYVQTTGPSRVPIPPPHAINRGIMVEGFGSFLSGAMGAGHATTSFSNVIGMIGITKVASRRVFNIAGLFMILMGICGPFGAVLVAIPKPVLTGPIFIAISLLVGAALSNLKDVDLWSTRSQGVLGISIMAGTVFPTWVQNHRDAFNTGSKDLDQSLSSFLGIPLIVGVVVSIVLDKTVPGTSRIQPPMTIQSNDNTDQEMEWPASGRVHSDLSLYDIPFISEWLSQWRVTKFIPFLPSPSKQKQLLKEVSSEDPPSPVSPIHK